MGITKLYAGVEGDPLNSSGPQIRDTVNQLIEAHVNNLKTLPTAVNAQTDTVYNVIGFYANTKLGGGRFIWNPTANKSTHNGGTIIAPEAISAWNGTQADIATLLNWTGSGSGCWVRSDLQGFVTPEMFGAVGDGVADDTNPCQYSIDLAKSISYTVLLSSVYLVGPLNIGGALSNYSIRGNGNAKFLHINGAGTLLFGSPSGYGYSLSCFDVDCKYGETLNPLANHGVVIENTSNIEISNVNVSNYKNSAIIVAASAANTYRNAVVEACAIDGGGLANNGILIVDYDYGKISNCFATGVVGSPGYAIQLKNNCRYSFILDCYAEGNRVSFAFGQEISSGVSHSNCCNLVSKNATVSAFVMGNAKNNKIENLIIDAGNLSGSDGVVISGESVGNSVSVTAENFAANRSACLFYDNSSANSIEIGHVGNINVNAFVCRFLGDSDNNDVLLKKSTNPRLPALGMSFFSRFESSAFTNSFRMTAISTTELCPIASDSITLKNSASENIVIDTEAFAVTDNLSNILGDLNDGRVVMIRTTSNNRDVTVQNNIGNILLDNGANLTLNHVSDTLTLKYNSGISKWVQCAIGNPV